MNKREKKVVVDKEISSDTLNRLVGYQMKRAFNVVQADLLETLKPFQLRMLTYTALLLIADNPELSQTQLATAMDIERANLVIIVDELETRELIVRNRVPTDRRVYALNATLAGRKLLNKANLAVERHEKGLFAGSPKNAREDWVKSLAQFHSRHSV